MDTDSQHVGFFVVPGSYLDELRGLYERWRESWDQHRDDRTVRYNELYRRARDVSLHYQQLDGEHMCWAHLMLVGEVFRSCRVDGHRDFLTPEETHRIAQALTKLERRPGGSDKLISRIARRDRYAPPEAFRAVYKAFRDTLMAADAQNAGFMSAVLDDNAEAELAEQHRQDEIRRQEAEERAKLPRPPGPTPGQLLDEYIERENLRRVHQEMARSDGLGNIWLCLVPEAELGAIRAILDKAYAHLARARKAATKRCFGEARELTLARATHVVELRKQGEQIAANAIYAQLRDAHPGLLDHIDVYTAAQAKAILAALHKWEKEQGGAPAAIALLGASDLSTPRLATRAYRGIKRALAASVKQSSGFVWLVSDDTRFFESMISRR